MKRLLALLLCAVMLFSVLGAEAWAADGDTLTVFDILSDKEIDPAEIGSYFGSEVRSVSFAFIPENSGGLEKYLYKEDDSTFFVLGKTLISDLPEILSFPALVHA